LANQVSGILGRNVSQVQQKCPDAFGQFNALRDALQKASQTDLFFETNLGKADSQIDQLIAAKANLENLRAQILEKLDTAKKAAETAIAEAKNTDPEAIIEANAHMNRTFEGLASELNPIFTEVGKQVAFIKEEAEKVVQNYLHEVAVVETGLKQGLDCYTKIVTKLTALHDKLTK